jgi:hypothetical protein
VHIRGHLFATRAYIPRNPILTLGVAVLPENTCSNWNALAGAEQWPGRRDLLSSRFGLGECPASRHSVIHRYRIWESRSDGAWQPIQQWSRGVHGSMLQYVNRSSLCPRCMCSLTYPPSSSPRSHEVVCPFSHNPPTNHSKLTHRLMLSRMQVLQTRAPMLSTLHKFAARDGEPNQQRESPCPPS